MSSSDTTGIDGPNSASAAQPTASPTASAGSTIPAACCTSPAFQAGLNITTAAPTCSAPYTADTNSGRFADISATRVPDVAPARVSVAAQASACARSSPKVKLRSSKSSATRSPSLEARRRRTSVSVCTTDIRYQLVWRGLPWGTE